MAFIVDFILLAASGAACFYCWVLSTRLKSLTSGKDGLKTGIAALSQSAEDMQNAMAETKHSANQNADRLQALLNEADKKIPELYELLQQLSEIGSQTVDETETAAQNLVDIIAPHTREAKVAAQLLLTALEETSRTAPGAILSSAQETLADAEKSVNEKDIRAEDKQEDDTGEHIEFIDVDKHGEAKGEAA